MVDCTNGTSIMQPCKTYFIAEVTFIIEREENEVFCIRIVSDYLTKIIEQQKLLKTF
jgi:hypothetical protein